MHFACGFFITGGFKMKKVLSFVLLFLLVMTLSGCSSLVVEDLETRLSEVESTLSRVESDNL